MPEHKFGPVLAERDELQVAYCSTCSYHHLTVLPDPQAVAEFYRNEFWSVEKPGSLAIIEEQLPWLRATWSDWLEILETETTDKRLLDFGCGWGHFAVLARERGWWPIGVEASIEAGKYASSLGIDCIYGPGEDVYFKHGGFGAVSMLWLLEHVVDPRALLTKAAEWASLLLVVAPNEFTVLQREASMVAATKNWWVHKTHLNYFTNLTLSTLLDDCGWTILHCFGSYPIEEFILAGQDYTAPPYELGKSLHASIRERELANPVERKQWHKYWGERGEGRDLAVICRRA